MTNRFTLRMDQDDLGHSVEVTFNEDFLDDVLMHVDMFLRGCGYVIDKYDKLEYVDNDPKNYNIKDDDVDMDGKC